MGKKKSGYSKKSSDWLGRSIIEHYNSEGKKTGHSRKGSDWLGRPRTEHYNTKGEKTGYNKKSSDWLGRSITERYNAKGEKTGYNKKNTDWLERPVIDRYNSKGEKTGFSRDSSDWLDRPVTEHYTYGSRSAYQPDPESAATSGVQSHQGAQSGNSEKTSDHSFLGTLLLVAVACVIAFLWLHSSVAPDSRSPIVVGPTHPTSQTGNRRRNAEPELPPVSEDGTNDSPKPSDDSTQRFDDNEPTVADAVPAPDLSSAELPERPAQSHATVTAIPSRRVFWAKHLHRFGSCEGQIQLTQGEFAFIGAVHTLHARRESIRGISGTGIIDSSGKRWHFKLTNISDSDAKAAIEAWYRPHSQDEGVPAN